jgi:hypothetical protein
MRVAIACRKPDPDGRNGRDADENESDRIRVRFPRRAPRDSSARHTTQHSYAQTLQIGMEVGQECSLLLEEARGSIPPPILVVLVFWLALIFTSFGLFAPTIPTVIGVLFACALSVAGAIFLILELDRPFQGLHQISSTPLRDALMHLGK